MTVLEFGKMSYQNACFCLEAKALSIMSGVINLFWQGNSEGGQSIPSVQLMNAQFRLPGWCTFLVSLESETTI